MDPVHDKGSMDPVHERGPWTRSIFSCTWSMDPVHGGGPCAMHEGVIVQLHVTP